MFQYFIFNSTIIMKSLNKKYSKYTLRICIIIIHFQD